MKLALFKTSHPNGKPFAADELTEKYSSDALRISEYVEVEFPPLSLEARQAQLAKVESAREAARAYYERQVKEINAQAEALQS